MEEVVSDLVAGLVLIFLGFAFFFGVVFLITLPLLLIFSPQVVFAIRATVLVLLVGGLFFEMVKFSISMNKQR